MEPSSGLEFRGREVAVTYTGSTIAHADAILGSKVLAGYLDDIQDGYTLTGLEITGVTMYGDMVGIIEMNVLLRRPDGSYIVPNHVELMSDAVAVLVVLQAPSGNYVTLVRQDRAAFGGSHLEIVAGLCNADNRSRQAINEINEELGLKKWGIHLTTDDLIELNGGRRKVMLPGTCNQGIWLFAAIIAVSDEFIRQFDGSEAGLESEGERTKVSVVKIRSLLDVLVLTDDGKTDMAVRAVLDQMDLDTMLWGPRY